MNWHTYINIIYRNKYSVGVFPKKTLAAKHQELSGWVPWGSPVLHRRRPGLLAVAFCVTILSSLRSWEAPTIGLQNFPSNVLLKSSLVCFPVKSEKWEKHLARFISWIKLIWSTIFGMPHHHFVSLTICYPLIIRHHMHTCIAVMFWRPSCSIHNWFHT